MSSFLKGKKIISILSAGVFLSTSIYFNVLATTVTTETSLQVRRFDFKSEQFTKPLKTNFISWINQHVISTHTPRHNGYDAVYTVGESQYIEGKFQYGDFRKDLENEWISIYEYSLDNSGASWKKLGRALTDSDGRIKYNIPSNMKLSSGLHLIKLYVEGDGTETNMYIQVLDSSKKYVVFDLDGTLTTSDFENIAQYASEFFNANYIAKMYDNANKVVDYYGGKGYGILYLSARPYWLSQESQSWCINKNMPMGLMHVSAGSEILSGQPAATFKTEYLNQLKAKGIEFSYGYGNTSTDVQAYVNSGISRNNIFTIGKEAGVEASTPIDSYANHLVGLSLR